MKKLKTLLALFLSGAMLLSCTACSDTEKTDESIKTVVVGTCASHAPYAYHAKVDGVDTITGSDIALAKKIADEAGYNLEIKDIPEEELLNQLYLGNLDFVLNAMPEQKDNQDVLCSDSYGENLLTCLISGKNTSNYTNTAALSGKTVGLLEGATQAELQALALPENSVVQYLPSDSFMQALRNGSVDAVILPKALADSYMQQNEDLTAAFTVSAGTTHLIVRYTNNIFLETVNDILEDVNKNKNMEDWLTDASQQYISLSDAEN